MCVCVLVREKMERKELTFIYWTWVECCMEEGEEEFPMRSAVRLGSKESIYKKPGRKLGKKGRLSSGPGSGVKLFLP